MGIKKIVALLGPSRAGKTSSLKALVQDYLRTGANGIFSKQNSYSRTDTIEVFEFYGQRICISSYGDDDMGINEGYKIALQYDCDVFVTASRSRHGSRSLAKVIRIAVVNDVSPIWLGAIKEGNPQRKVKADLMRCRMLRYVIESL